MPPRKRAEIERRLERLEARRSPPSQALGIPILSEEELAAMSNEELKALCERFLAQVELTPEELAMTADELHEHCCRLVREDQVHAGLFN
ncbi:hypothetical protein [Geminicoccus flavidas]|uniref:hypothetical protein n=1 Tax=Geminicoccus flavidas TaxID=2506407 RepID=UPI001357026B|nr:hypothetical protein [Geminicoccus flavidas]